MTHTREVPVVAEEPWSAFPAMDSRAMMDPRENDFESDTDPTFKVARQKLNARACSERLEPEANASDKWQKIMVEVKETKRQWADVEDSDEEAQAVVVVQQSSER